MERLFSTREIHPRDRFDYWHDVVCSRVADQDSHPESRHTFEAEAYSGAVADLGLLVVQNTPLSFEHTTRHAARTDGDLLLICRLITGEFVLDQGWRDIALKPGDVMLLDPRLSYAGRTPRKSSFLIVTVPRRLLEARIGPTRELAACPIKPENGEGHLMSAFLTILPAEVGKLSPAAEEIVKNQTLDLIAIALTTATDGRRPRLSSARSVVLMSLRAAVEARLDDPALDAGAVAAAAGVSERYANAVLADEGTSIAHLIQSMRLERCRKALEDPQQIHRTITDIAYSWGFSDMTHFGRKFRAAYGALPSEHRRALRSELCQSDAR